MIEPAALDRAYFARWYRRVRVHTEDEVVGKAAFAVGLAEHVLGSELPSSERTLDVHVSRLRKKLGPQSPIETVWAIGYRLAAGREP